MSAVSKKPHRRAKIGARPGDRAGVVLRPTLVRSAPTSPRFARGVYICPWLDEHGETMVFSRDRWGKLFEGPVAVPLGAEVVTVADPMWDRLDAGDPIPMLHIV